jgi:MFS family permease
VASLVVAMVLLSWGTLPTFIAGMALQLFAGACLEIGISLFMMDHVPRQELGKFEPIRIFYSGIAWVIGPMAGIMLKNQVAPWAPFVLSGGAGVIFLAYFWYLRLSENPAVTTKRKPVINPLRYGSRFFSQPRLIVAWVLAIGRAGWWGMFFVYTPIYVVSVGLGENIAGAMSSIGALVMFTIPLMAPVNQRYGARPSLIAGYTLCGIATITTALVFASPWIGMGVLLLAALCAMPIDSVGNLAFLRAVHPYERAEMTTIFSTYRTVQQLVLPALFSGILMIFPLQAVFVASGTIMVALGGLSRYIPKKLK